MLSIGEESNLQQTVVYLSICPVYDAINWTLFTMKTFSSHGHVSIANIANLQLFYNFIHDFFCYPLCPMLEDSHGSLPINLILYLHADL